MAILAVHHVHVAGQTLTGGAEKYLCMAADALLRTGAAVHIAYSGQSIYDELLNEYAPDRLTVEHTGWLDDALTGDRAISLSLIRQRRRWIRATGADTVLAVQQDGGRSFAASLLAARSLGLRVVSTIRQPPPEFPRARSGGPTRRQIWQRQLPAWCSDAIIFNSRRVAEGYCGLFGFPVDRIHVIRNGERAIGRPRHIESHDQIRFGVVGRISEAKGADVALEAFRIISERNAQSILNYFGEGPLASRLQESSAQMGLADRVRFAGYHNERERIYREMDVCLHLSHRESLSNSVIEALCRGIPCIATDVGGMREVVEDGSNGLLVPAGDVAACVDAMDRLMTEPGLYRQCSLGAITTGQKMFDPDRFDHETTKAILG